MRHILDMRPATLIVRLAILALLLCQFQGAASALDPDKALTQYSVKTWKSEDGLPDNHIFAITQSRDGNLWLVTRKGPVLYDGVSFYQKFTSNPETVFRTILATRSGKLLSGAEKLQELQNDAWRILSGVTYEGKINALLEDSKDNLWIGTHGSGLQRCIAGKCSRVESDQDMIYVQALMETTEQSIWVATDGAGLYRFHEGRWTRFTTKDGLANDSIFAMTQTADGDVWIGTYAGLNRLHDGQWTSFTTANSPLPRNLVRSLLQDKDGNLWVGTDAGLSRLDHGEWSHFTDEAILNSEIYSIYEDRERNLWIGSAAGLVRLTDQAWSLYTGKEGLPGGQVHSVLEDTSGRLLAATDAGLYARAGKSWSPVAGNAGLPAGQVNSLIQSRDGSLWAGTPTGVAHLENGRWTVQPVGNGSSGTPVLALFEDRDGTLWVGTRLGGLSRFKNGAWTTFGVRDGLTSEYVRSIRQDHLGRLWIGMNRGGIACYEDGRFTVYSAKQGLSSNLVLTSYEDRDGNLWIGTDGGGLNLLRNGKITHFSSASGLADEAVNDILEDREGTLWMGSGNGIFSVRKQDLLDFADHKVSGFHSFSMAPGTDCITGTKPSAIIGSDGNMWFASTQGLVRVDPRSPYARQRFIPPKVEWVQADGQPFTPGSVVVVAPGTRTIRLHYTALTLRNPESIRFRYMLDGFDSNWIDAVSRRNAFYTNLNPGRYTFRLSSGVNGSWNPVETRLTIEQRPFYYQTTWFRIVLLLLVLLTALLFHRLGVRDLERRKVQLQQLIQQRTEDLERTNEALQLEVQRRIEAERVKDNFLSTVSHELRSPLTSILGSLELLEGGVGGAIPPSAAKLVNIANRNGELVLHLANQLLDILRIETGRTTIQIETLDAVPLVEEAILSNQAYAARYRNRYSLANAPTGIKLKADRSAFLQIMTNLLSNAARFSPPDEDILITIQPRGDFIRISISDRGPGVPEDFHDRIFEEFSQAVPHDAKHKGGSGLGLSISRKLVELMDGKIGFTSQPGAGATFFFDLPVASAA